MRLTHLKLAGFKSFVDPTTLHIHGQRVGVVGPNGCGKSNVMESVRWVLGESSAKEMRGDSMADVIFNGSGNRKAISRASVELIFDNSLGGAFDNSAGEWSQYAEIAVKRVIERDKGSSYFINNTPVRRRDVADLFLGTGLGGRAYAIIGQNTISRIVEAKPEELRVFLEEAAGISKYKERRRETELRLRDTRENLVRVEDIRREIDKQIARLESQAAVTAEFHRLQDALKLAQGQLWLLKKRDAALQLDKAQRQVEKLVNGLEAQMAELRKSESLVETLRQQHYAATEQVQSTQTRYYEANAEVSNLEQQVRHTQEARERLTQQLQQITQQAQKTDAQLLSLQQQLAQLEQQQQQSAAQQADAERSLHEMRQGLPEKERAFSAAQARHAVAQKLYFETEQNIKLESAGLDHLNRSLQEQQQRLQQLENELKTLQVPDSRELEQRQQESLAQAQAITTLEQQVTDHRVQEQALITRISQTRERQLQDQRALTQAEAQIASLARLQQAMGQESKLEAWLKTAGLTDAARIWQKVSIETGWETALESALGARLNALLQTSLPAPQGQRPPASLVISEPGMEIAAKPNPDLRPILSLLSFRQARLAGLMQDWLAHLYLLEDDSALERLRTKLRPGEALVNRAGDLYTRHSVSYHAAQSSMHGVLERQRELETLEASIPALQSAVSQSTAALAEAEAALQQSRQQAQSQQQALRNATQAQHQLTLDIQRLQQQQSHMLERQRSMQAELVTLRQRIDGLRSESSAKQQALTGLEQAVSEQLTQREQSQQLRRDAETVLNEARVALLKAERMAQEKSFDSRIFVNNINEIKSKLTNSSEEKATLAVRLQETETLLEAARMDTLKTNLEAALILKQTREKELADARNQMAGVEQSLQNEERTRMQNEQQLHPQRDKLEQARLHAQESRIHFEQCQQGLSTVGLDEAMLEAELSASARLSEIERKVTATQQEIEALGAVNLAATQELASELERKSYLDHQAADLDQAIQTLEDAIRRIDKETRTRLQNTFDEANRHFGELFTTLFGGGQARLELLGEEILDTGMQVFAQPPGKKNSTIHLLSGGEKALTALALVFALFRLNPAPFCLMDEVDAPLDDSNTERFCHLVKKMSERTQFLFVSHNKITMEMAQQLIGVTMQESGVSRIVEVDIEAAMQMNAELVT
ncbi:MAG TPA: chromosome segregation protein SMC [Methylophilaceae bacterium]|nr:chromosome segregation protein SMC [Methylophilaceae bacterium]